MSNRAHAWEMRERNRDEMAVVDTTGQELKDRILEKIEKRVAAIREQIKSLHEEKEELVRGKITRDELLENALSAYRKGRAQYLKEVIAKHLSACQFAGAEPFQPLALRHDFWDELRGMEIFFMAVSESDIHEAIKLVEAGGLSAKERESKIKALDKKISAVRSELENELAQVKADR